MVERVKGVLVAIALWTGLIMMGNAKAYYVTMDIDSSIRSGTILCESVHKCYITVLQMEARGAHNYCNSITIKRDGKVVWGRNYWKNPADYKTYSHEWEE